MVLLLVKYAKSLSRQLLLDLYDSCSWLFVARAAYSLSLFGHGHLHAMQQNVQSIVALSPFHNFVQRIGVHRAGKSVCLDGNRSVAAYLEEYSC